MTVKDQNLITILLAFYGVWQLAGAIGRWLFKPRKTRVYPFTRDTVALPPPDRAAKRHAEILWRQDCYRRRLERQG